MEVILKQPVNKLGDIGDVVKVKAGFARNYLIPKGIAEMATANRLKAWKESKRQAEHKQEFLIEKAQTLATKMGEAKILIRTLAGKEGKLFGSVTALMVANKLKEQDFIVDRRKITLDDIRSTGEYVATVHLHKEVKAKVNIVVLSTDEDEDEANTPQKEEAVAAVVEAPAAVAEEVAETVAETAEAVEEVAEEAVAEVTEVAEEATEAVEEVAEAVEEATEEVSE